MKADLGLLRSDMAARADRHANVIPKGIGVEGSEDYY